MKPSQSTEDRFGFDPHVFVVSSAEGETEDFFVGVTLTEMRERNADMIDRIRELAESETTPA